MDKINDDFEKNLRNKRNQAFLSELRVIASVLQFSSLLRKKNPIIDEYYKAVAVLNNEDGSDYLDKLARDKILECIRQALNIAIDTQFFPNDDNYALEKNLDIVFQEIGLENGRNDVMLAYNDQQKYAFVAALIKKAKEPVIIKDDNNEQFLRLRITDLSEEICSLELKEKLKSRYYSVADLLNTTLEELKMLLGENTELYKYLVQLEVLFRVNGISFLDIFPLPNDEQDRKAIALIKDSVTAKIGHLKSLYKDTQQPGL